MWTVKKLLNVCCIQKKYIFSYQYIAYLLFITRKNHLKRDREHCTFLFNKSPIDKYTILGQALESNFLYYLVSYINHCLLW